MKQKPKIILASQSPRRRMLLKRLMANFECEVAEIEETASRHLTPNEIAKTNAHRKALAVAKNHPKALVIGSDTVVALASKTFAKPKDLQEAAGFLKKLSGKTHQVITGVSLLCLEPFKVKLFSETTHVGFQKLNDQNIREYLSMINPLDKAGGYAIQEHGEWIIGEIFGSYTNVVGLPMERLREELKLW
jgi:septum formation protein